MVVVEKGTAHSTLAGGVRIQNSNSVEPRRSGRGPKSKPNEPRASSRAGRALVERLMGFRRDQPPLRRKSFRQLDRRDHARRVSFVFARDIEGRAVIRRRADEWKA